MSLSDVEIKQVLASQFEPMDLYENIYESNSSLINKIVELSGNRHNPSSARILIRIWKHELRDLSPVRKIEI